MGSNPEGFDRQISLINEWQRKYREWKGWNAAPSVGEDVGRYIAQHHFLSIVGTADADADDGSKYWWVLGVPQPEEGPGYWTKIYSGWTADDHKRVVAYAMANLWRLDKAVYGAASCTYHRIAEDLRRYDELDHSEFPEWESMMEYIKLILRD